jgi:adenosylhomocysteine nucleosidase
MSENGVKSRFVILISAEAEWKVIRSVYADVKINISPFGDWFNAVIQAYEHTYEVTFTHGGWGKIAAAASTQYIIDHFGPELLINIGTCGAFDHTLQRGDIILASKTLVYDIVEQMGDPDEAIQAYATDIDNSWLKNELPKGTREGLLISGDRDIIQTDINELRQKYGATAADWESGAITWTAARNHMPILILRGVSDLVTEEAAKAYGNMAHFENGTTNVITTLLSQLPEYISAWDKQ